MRKRWKKSSAYLAILFLFIVNCLFAGVSVYAMQDGNVYDDAQLLTESEIGALNEEIAILEELSGWNVYAVTTADAEGKSANAYADDFFDTHSPEQEDGVAVLIDMDNREIAISTSGEAIRYLTDERINYILDEAYSDISDARYKDCLGTMLDGVTKYYDAGIEDGQYNYDVETGEISVYRSLTFFEIIIALALAVGAGALVYGIVVGKYRLKFDTYKYEFRNNSQVKLRIKEDRFINQTVTHRRIPKQTNSGGGGGGAKSSVHTSSSGRSHGGGSRKF